MSIFECYACFSVWKVKRRVGVFPYTDSVARQIQSKILGELKNVLLTLSIDPKIHQIVDIVVDDVPENYGMWLSRDWYEN